jgi:hypothetical protein
MERGSRRLQKIEGWRAQRTGAGSGAAMRGVLHGPWRARALLRRVRAMQDMAPAPLEAMERESSTTSITWYWRLEGLVRRSQILSFLKPEAM